MILPPRPHPDDLGSEDAKIFRTVGGQRPSGVDTALERRGSVVVTVFGRQRPRAFLRS